MTIEIKGRLEVIQTITGAFTKRANCIMNRDTGQYYEKNVSCFQVDMGDGRLVWNRIDNGKIAFNYTEQKWQLIKFLESSGLLKGIYDTNKTMGYFLKDENVVWLKERFDTSSSIPCVSLELAIKLGYISSLWDEFLYNKNSLSPEQFRALKQPKIVKYRNLAFNYNASADNSAFIKIKEQYALTDVPISNREQDVSKLLFGKSFGIELESRNGSLLEKDLGRLGLVPLKDGSLRWNNGEEPYEYATVPFYGAKGLATIKHICKELSERCVFDEKCSLHIHLGNVKYDELTIIAYYMLIQTIQEELYSIFPQYKRSEMEYLGTPKNYNSPLPNIGLLTNNLFKKNYDSSVEFNADVHKYFTKIVNWLTDGQVQEFPMWNTNETYHPLGGTKWNIHSRYFLTNFNNLVFSNTRTCEFRLSNSTFNYTKIVNWLFICIGIITFAERYSKEIISRKMKPTLNDILDGYKTSFGFYSFNDVLGTEISNYLKDYIEFRKVAIKKANSEGDWLARNIEFGEIDKNFKFDNGVISNIL